VYVGLEQREIQSQIPIRLIQFSRYFHCHVELTDSYYSEKRTLLHQRCIFFCQKNYTNVIRIIFIIFSFIHKFLDLKKERKVHRVASIGSISLRHTRASEATP